MMGSGGLTVMVSTCKCKATDEFYVKCTPYLCSFNYTYFFVKEE